MTSSQSPSTDTEEQTWRANTYRLLARLLNSPPDQELLLSLAAIETSRTDLDENDMTLAWLKLAREAPRKSDILYLNDEFHNLFIGMTRGELLPYGSFYQTGFLMEKPLAILREDLQKLGFKRRHEIHEPEDHAAALCEVMSMMIDQSFSLQAEFFKKHIHPWFGQFFADLERSESAVFYKAVARLGTAFIELEHRYLTVNNLTGNSQNV